MASSCISATEPNWLELPRDLTMNILQRIGTIEIVTSVCQVCSIWWNICKDPLMWRAIRMTNVFYSRYDYPALVKICCYAVERSCGQLDDINIKYFATDDLLEYIVDCASHLRRMRLVECEGLTEKGFIEAVKKLPLLEELAISFEDEYLSKDSLEVVGQYCHRLKSLRYSSGSLFSDGIKWNDEALAITKTMPGLHRLKLSGSVELTKVGVLAILDGCPLLESLDLQQCSCLFFSENLKEMCHGRIKDVYFPLEKYYSSSEDDLHSENSNGSCDCGMCNI